VRDYRLKWFTGQGHRWQGILTARRINMVCII